MRYLLSGIGGIGLSALAWSLIKDGNEVYGSDRSYDQGLFPEKFKTLSDMGIKLTAQNGDIIREGKIGCVVASSAVEPKVPDIAAAMELGIPIQKRPELLADMLNAKQKSVAIAGTSGKSTVTALCGYFAKECGLDPTIINGAKMPNFDAKSDAPNSPFGNARAGDSDVLIAEACESDGSVILYKPYISLINNITLDHKPIEELKPLFQQLIDHTHGQVVINCDDSEAMGLRYSSFIGYSCEDHPDAYFKAKNILLNSKGVQFDLIIGDSDAYEVHAPLMGKHNVQNLLASFAVLDALGVDVYDCIKALSGFKGIKSRMEHIGTVNGITIIDDYAHNPDKITAALQTVTQHSGRVLAYYQPHGFAPTKLMREGYVEAFSQNLRPQDRLYLQEIYYAGGTVDKDISSKDIANDIRKLNTSAISVYEDRDKLINEITKEADTNDTILIMGARDDSIRDIAPRIYDTLGT